MTHGLLVRAPGKLFLLGEYAVLDGCPAVVAAVDRGVEVKLVARAPGRHPAVRLAAGSHGSVEFPAARPPAANGPLRFAIAAYRSMLERLPGLAKRAAVIDITADRDAKVGLGSSAAVTVAVVAALYAAAGGDPAQSPGRRVVLAAALEAHRHAQGGVGSGADIAASLTGGVVLFDPRPEGLPHVAPVPLPSDLRLLVGWSGAPAATVGLVQRYRAQHGTPAQVAFVRGTRQCVARFVTTSPDPAATLAAFDDNGRLLEQLADDLALPLLTPALRHLLGIARQQGAAAKISGAGGGDCGIALTRDAAAVARISCAWRAAGVTPLALSIGTAGVSVGRL